MKIEMKWIHTMRGTKVVKAVCGSWVIELKEGLFYINGPGIKNGGAASLAGAKAMVNQLIAYRAHQTSTLMYKMEEPTKDTEEDRVATQKAKTEQPPYSPEARNAGETMAKVIFQKHGTGNNVEIPMSKEMLASVLAMAYDFGAKRSGPLR